MREVTGSNAQVGQRVVSLNPSPESFRVGVVLVAYNAERTLGSVLERIPQDFWSETAGVWISDDNSRDRTHRVAREWHTGNPDRRVTIVRQPVNLGYGGNQKAGYRWAIEENLDCVVLLHGDGQYAPEVIDTLVGPIARGEADAVLGSRFLTKGGAREGGMPLYKYLGNRVLTTIQNRIAGTEFSEWHSGYRAYAVSALRGIEFEGNSNGFDFDTEILLQLLSTDKRIAEVPIPTYYGDEVSYVSGVRYAFDVLTACVRWRLQKVGFGSGHLASVGPDYAMRESLTGSHQTILARLARQAPSRILDLGCGAGWMAQLLEEYGHTVVGIDRTAHPGVEGRMSHFVEADLEDGLPDSAGSAFDVIVAADVLEHLSQPERLLADMKRALRPGGVVLVSIPNFGHWYPRLRTLLGNFDYDQRGILDRTHLRFFSRRSMRRLLGVSGYLISSETPLGSPEDILELTPKGPRRRIPRALSLVERACVRVRPQLFAYQFLYELTLPVHTERASAANEATNHLRKEHHTGRKRNHLPGVEPFRVVPRQPI